MSLQSSNWNFDLKWTFKLKNSFNFVKFGLWVRPFDYTFKCGDGNAFKCLAIFIAESDG